MQFKTLVEAVACWAEKTPDKTCLIDADTDASITYGEFWRQICIFAWRLLEAGLKKGERVVVRVGPLLETYVAQFGIYLAGGVYCPVEKHLKEIKLLEMLEYFDSSMLVSMKRISHDCVWIDLASAIADGAAEPETPAFPDPNDLCCIIFSTGTTGKAKGIMRSFDTVINSAMGYARAYGFSKNDVFMWVQTLDRSISVAAVYGILAVGGSAVHHDGIVFMHDVFNSLACYSATVLYLQSFALSMFLEAAPEAFAAGAERLRLLPIGGGVLSEAHKEKLVAMLPKTELIVIYASSECSLISYYKYNSLLGKPSCGGKTAQNIKVHMLDNNCIEMKDASKNNLGIIAIESSSTMLGYWNDPEQTARALKDGLLITTDMGYMDNEGYLYLMGRRDDVIVTGGYKVAPYEIEEIAIQYEGVQECICVAYPDKVMASIPKLFVKMEDDAEFSSAKLHNFLAQRLETFKIPRIICEIDSFPRVGNSEKIDRKALRNYD